MKTIKTVSAKEQDIEKEWIEIDASGVVLGRLASYVAKILRGKHRPYFTPHANCGDFVVITNADKIKLTGRKRTDKIYYHHTGHPGGIKQKTAEFILSGKNPERVFHKAVERMMPKESPLARQQLKQLHIYTGGEHPHAAQQPKKVDFAAMNVKNAR
jgi:large subunit ribosomal protein L13